MNTVSPKYERVGDADMGRIDESSVLARLWVDGVDGKLWSDDDRWRDWVHLESMEASWDCGAGLSRREGMARERAGRSLEVRGVGGMEVHDSEGVGGTVTREEERRRPRVARVSGGRTFVEDARCLLGGGAGGQREADMARKQRRRRGRRREADWAEITAERPPSLNGFFDFSVLPSKRHHLSPQLGLSSIGPSRRAHMLTSALLLMGSLRLPPSIPSASQPSPVRSRSSLCAHPPRPSSRVWAAPQLLFLWTAGAHARGRSCQMPSKLPSY